MNLPKELEQKILARSTVGPPPRLELEAPSAAEPTSRVVTITLPWGPSTNHHWIPVPVVTPTRTYARLILSPDGKIFREEVAIIAHQMSPRPKFGKARLGLTLVVCPPNNQKIDIGNRLKPVEDALQACWVFDNDEQIDIEVLRRGDITPGGKLVVSIWPLGTQPY
jgi:crossover junction endodeoxyribonuclease RusA